MQAAPSPLSWFGNNQTPFISKPLGSLLPQGTCWSWALASIKLPRLQRDRDRVESPRIGLGKGPVCCSASMCCRSQAQPHQSWFSRSFRRLSNSRPRTQTTINGEPSGLRDETASGEEDISSGTQWKPSFDRHLGVGESDLRQAPDGHAQHLERDQPIFKTSTGLAPQCHTLACR